MSDILEALEAAISLDMQQVEVPALGGKVVYFKPITCRDINDLQKRYKNFLTDPPLEGMIDLVIKKALNADGSRMFTIEHKLKLMSSSPEIVATMATAMLGASTVADQEKNS